MNANPTLTPELPTTHKNAPRLRVIRFQVGQLTLAIRIEAIVKILKNVSIEGTGTNSFGIAHIGDQEITILDLQYQLFQQRTALDPANPNNHLIVIHTATGEPFGIPVTHVPTLEDLSLNTVRVLPDSYRRTDSLSMATHVAALPGDGANPQTLFILDPQLLNPFATV